ncbi:MAG: pentapeptide repeat-containing protein [Nostoc sp.]
MLKRYAAGERDFSGINLEEADLSGANLSGANLSRANHIGS